MISWLSEEVLETKYAFEFWHCRWSLACHFPCEIGRGTSWWGWWGWHHWQFVHSSNINLLLFVFSSLIKFFLRECGISDVVSLEENCRLFKEVAYIFCLVFPLKNVSVFITQLTIGEVKVLPLGKLEWSRARDEQRGALKRHCYQRLEVMGKEFKSPGVHSWLQGIEVAS